MKKVLTKRIKKIPAGVRLFLAISPLLIMYIVLNYFPLYGWVYAFFDYKATRSLPEMEFVGLRNFTSLFSNPIIKRQTLRALRNTLIMSGIGISTSFLPMFFAIALNELRSSKLKKIVQTVTTIPNFVSWVIVYSIALGLFSMENGVVNYVLKSMGVITESISFLSSDKHVYLTSFLWGTWKGIGWSAVIYLAGISGIDQELMDAASIDGARRFQRIRYVTIPCLMPTFITLMILSIGNLLNSGMDYQLVFGNAFNLEYLENIDYLVFSLGLASGKVSQAIAIGITKSLVALVLLFFSNWVSGKVREEKIF